MDTMTNDNANQAAGHSLEPGRSADLRGLIGGAVAGASLMYFLDPQQGNRRRGLVADRVNHAMHVAADAAGKTARDARNRTRGLTATVRSRVTRDDAADPWVLVERVRAELGRAVSHPGAIRVEASDDVITLEGDVLAGEVDGLLDHVHKVRGVTRVIDNLRIHQTADDVPGLQGGKPRTGERSELRQEHWTPAARLLMSVIGGSLSVYGTRHRNPLGAAAGVAGLALLTRAVTNAPLVRLAGDGRTRAIDGGESIETSSGEPAISVS